MSPRRLANKLAILKFAALAVLAIAALGALSSYVESLMTLHNVRIAGRHHQYPYAGRHGRHHVLLQLAIHPDRALGCARAVPGGVRFTRRIKKASPKTREKQSEIVSVIEELFSSIRVVKAFAREDYEQRPFEEQSLESVEAALSARKIKATLSPLVAIIVAAGTCLVLWFGARMALDGSLSAGALILFIMYLGKMYKPMQELSKMTDAYTKAAVGYDRIREVLETEHDVKNLPGARPARRSRSSAPTGSGKTTIISLIPRFYDPTSGTVKIDGQDVRVSGRSRSASRSVSYCRTRCSFTAR